MFLFISLSTTSRKWVHKSFSLKEFREDTNLGSLPCGVSSRSEKLLCTPESLELSGSILV